MFVMGSALVVTGCKCFCFDGYIYIYMKQGMAGLFYFRQNYPCQPSTRKEVFWCLNNSWIWISVVSKKTELQHQLMVESRAYVSPTNSLWLCSILDAC